MEEIMARIDYPLLSTQRIMLNSLDKAEKAEISWVYERFGESVDIVFAKKKVWFLC